MKSRIWIASLLLSTCVAFFPAGTAQASMPMEASSHTSTTSTFPKNKSSTDKTESIAVEPNGLLTTKYRVCVDSVTIRSGPGTSYSSTGTLKRGAFIYVYSVKNGWAKFKANSKWNYVPRCALKKC